MTGWCVVGAVAVAGLLSGCSVVSLSPVPLWEMAKAMGSLAADAAHREPGQATQVVRHAGPPLSELCIEFNPQTPTSDLVPTLQQLLLRHQVRSRVYDARTPPDRCEVWLTYSAQIDWDTRALSDRYEPFISRAELTLRTGHGRVLATGQYRYDARQWRASQWASTHDKLDAVVTALVANP